MAARSCTVSFEDSQRIRHSVEVVAASLYEAAVLALKQFRASSFADTQVGKGTRLKVSVHIGAESHEVSVSQVETWLASVGKGPREETLKADLRKVLEGQGSPIG